MPERVVRAADSIATRTGPGRWCTVMTPCPGILWTNDDDAMGFVAIGQVDDTVFDSTDVDEQMQANIDAGLGFTKAFDLMAATLGKNIETGSLTNWKPSKMRRRPDLGPDPVVTSTVEVKRLVVAQDEAEQSAAEQTATVLGADAALTDADVED
ncbi:hypothetical protein [Gordonia sp. OPL2]|uniref:hypothetical protein n=1 Tax=Gordonia sp. OPL2 TaxID=2486274 RepID=UPI001654CAB8|nr:hypothetical protein [Gordonia sp. OPL2]ROZ88999.1 hypothetical protein EEB19_20020 [Gordonia sp. OPL2]